MCGLHEKISVTANMLGCVKLSELGSELGLEHAGMLKLIGAHSKEENDFCGHTKMSCKGLKKNVTVNGNKCNNCSFQKK